MLVMNIETIATFFGWCTVINIGCLVFAGLFWILAKEWFSQFGATLFGVTSEDLKVTFLRVLMQYRAAIFILNIVPYIALKIIT